MRNFNFSMFEVDDTNRAAFEACRAIADLEPVAPLPIVLVGEKGSGKTHLLCAIVDHLKTGSGATGLAFVSARRFSSEVRQLLQDPHPVERARSAVLLVDDLEDFRDYVEELEAVVRLFLDNGHPVVVASDVHPRRLPELTDEFKTILSCGQVLSLTSSHNGNHETSAQYVVQSEMEEMLKRQRDEILGLRDELADAKEKAEALEERVRQATARAQSAEQQRAETGERLQEAEHGLEELEAANAALTAQLETGTTITEDLRQQLKKQHAEAHELQQQIDGQQERIQALEGDVEGLRAVEARLQNQIEQKELLAEKLRGQIESRGHELERVDNVLGEAEARIRELREDVENHKALAAEVGELREKAYQTEQELELVRGDLAQAEQDRAKLVGQLAAQAGVHDEVRALRTRLSGVEAERDSARAETARLSEAAQAMLDKLCMMQGRAENARDEMNGRIRKLDKLFAQCGETLGLTPEEAASGDVDLSNALRIQLERAHQAIEARLISVKREADEAREAREQALEKHDRLMAAHAALEVEVEDVRAQQAAQTQEMENLRHEAAAQVAAAQAQAREMENLRHEAAAQVAAAQAQAGDTERKYAELLAIFNALRGSAGNVAGEIGHVNEALLRASEGLAALANRLTNALDVDIEDEDEDEDDGDAWRGSAPSSPSAAHPETAGSPSGESASDDMPSADISSVDIPSVEELEQHVRAAVDADFEEP